MNVQNKLNISFSLRYISFNDFYLPKRNLFVRFLHNSNLNKNKHGPVDIKGRNPTERKWLVRQMKDPFVKKARQEDYRCRSCFKLLEMQEKFNLLHEGQVVVDVGAAPGSWSQIAVEKVLPHLNNNNIINNYNINNKMNNSNKNSNNSNFMSLNNPYNKSQNSNNSTDTPNTQGLVLGIDLQSIQPLPGVTFLCNSDIMQQSTQQQVLSILNPRRADVVLSDVAPQATGVRELDGEASTHLLYTVLKFSLLILKQNGTFLTKAFQGRGLNDLIEKSLGKCFEKVQLVKPKASRADSSEIYVLARNFKL